MWPLHYICTLWWSCTTIFRQQTHTSSSSVADESNTVGFLFCLAVEFNCREWNRLFAEMCFVNIEIQASSPTSSVVAPPMMITSLDSVSTAMAGTVGRSGMSASFCWSKSKQLAASVWLHDHLCKCPVLWHLNRMITGKKQTTTQLAMLQTCSNNPSICGAIDSKTTPGPSLCRFFHSKRRRLEDASRPEKDAAYHSVQK